MSDPKQNDNFDQMPEIELPPELQRQLDEMNARHAAKQNQTEILRRKAEEAEAKGIPVFGELTEDKTMVNVSTDYDPIHGFADALLTQVPGTEDGEPPIKPIRLMMKRLGRGVWVQLPVDPDDPANVMPPWASEGHKIAADQLCEQIENEHRAGKYPPTVWDDEVPSELVQLLAPVVRQSLEALAKSKPLPRGGGDGDIQMPPPPFAA